MKPFGRRKPIRWPVGCKCAECSSGPDKGAERREGHDIERRALQGQEAKP